MKDVLFVGTPRKKKSARSSAGAKSASTGSSTAAPNSEWSYKIEVPLYADMELVIGVAEKDVGTLIKKHFKSADNDDYCAVCCHNGKKIGVFFERPWLSMDVIAHEVSHATFRIAQYTGWNLNSKTNEPFAYLMGWIMKTVINKLGDHDEKIRS